MAPPSTSASTSSYTSWQPLAPSFAPASPPRAPTPSTSHTSHHLTGSMLPPMSPAAARRRNNLGHGHTHSIASSSSHSQAVYHPQPTRSGRLPIAPRQEEINAMLSMENYFEFPSESESDDEDFVPPPTVDVENEETPQYDNDDSIQASPGRNSKGKRRAANQDADDTYQSQQQQQQNNDAGYSSATEIGTIDNAEWEWLMDQMNSIENGGGTLDPGPYPSLPRIGDGGYGLGNASEADADGESGSSPAKEGDFLSPVETTQQNGSSEGGYYTSSWPYPSNADNARTIFASTTHQEQVPLQNLGSAYSQADQNIMAGTEDRQAQDSFIPYTKKPPVKKAQPAPSTAAENNEEAVRYRAASGKFTKASKRGKEKPVRLEKFPTEVIPKKTAATASNQSTREESIISTTESQVAESTPAINPYTTIVPRKRGRAKHIPLSPRAEAAQAELRTIRHLEQCDDYRERKKLKKFDWEKRISLLEEENGKMLEENKLLRSQLETLKAEREKDRRALIEANTRVRQGKDGRTIISRRGIGGGNTNSLASSVNSQNTDGMTMGDSDDGGEGEKENNLLHALGGGSGKVAVSLEDLGKFAATFMAITAQKPSSLPVIPQTQTYQHPHQQQVSYQQQQEQGFAVPHQQQQQQSQQGVDLQAILGLYGQYATGQKQ